MRKCEIKSHSTKPVRCKAMSPTLCGNQSWPPDSWPGGSFDHLCPGCVCTYWHHSEIPGGPSGLALTPLSVLKRPRGTGKGKDTGLRKPKNGWKPLGCTLSLTQAKVVFLLKAVFLFLRICAHYRKYKRDEKFNHNIDSCHDLIGKNLSVKEHVIRSRKRFQKRKLLGQRMYKGCFCSMKGKKTILVWMEG